MFQLKTHLESLVPKGLLLEFSGEDVGMWWKTDPVGPAFDIAAKALEQGYNHPVAFIAGGGSIPFVKPFSDHMGGIPAILLGLEDPICNAHSENESLDLSDFQKAIRANIFLYDGFGTSYSRP